MQLKIDYRKPIPASVLFGGNFGVLGDTPLSAKGIVVVDFRELQFNSPTMPLTFSLVDAHGAFNANRGMRAFEFSRLVPEQALDIWFGYNLLTEVREGNEEARNMLQPHRDRFLFFPHGPRLNRKAAKEGEPDEQGLFYIKPTPVDGGLTAISGVLYFSQQVSAVGNNCGFPIAIV